MTETIDPQPLGTMPTGGNSVNAAVTSANAFKARVVVLGASNVARGISTIVQLTKAVHGAPVDFMAANGRGRSYGINSCLLGRGLPGILDCGLWKALEHPSHTQTALAQQPQTPTYALVTDIGNDILYGVEPETIASWVETCVERLLNHNAHIVITQLPVDNLALLSPGRFKMMRRLLFPNNRASFAEIQQRVFALNQLVKTIGEKHPIQLVSQETSWYGFDPIHFQMRNWRKVWSYILGHWLDASASSAQQLEHQLRCDPLRWLKLSFLAPEKRSILNFPRSCSQPAARLRDGTTISLY